MSSLRSVRPYVALVATAALGGAVAVGAVALLGGLDGGTTVVTETVAAQTTRSAPPTGNAISVNEIYERAAPGVVQITSTSRATDAFSGDTPSALGSGFVVDKAGHVVTNFHVVEGADAIRVSFSNRDTVQAELVGTDPSTDLAVLRVDSSASALTPLPLGDSDLVRVGDPVVAIGNPFGLDRTATAGIVSALQRLIQAPNRFTIDHVIQTDAPINKGNSGGPLLNDRGQVIAVNTQIETGGISTGNVGIGFAVPSNTVKDVLAQIVQTGKVDHAYLGISGTDVTPQLANVLNLSVKQGALVQSVVSGGPADKAGVKGGHATATIGGQQVRAGGDVITAIDGKAVSGMDDVISVVNQKQPGDKVELSLADGSQNRTVTVTLGNRPATAKP